MKLRTLIIDDEPIALEKLRSYVEKVPFLELAAACHSGIDAMAVLAAEKIDLIFTDIDMPDLNGMELAGSLADAPMIVFTTAYAQYAVDSYRLSAVDYLLKPYSFADFQRAANKALAQAQRDGADTQREAGSVFVKVDYRYVRVKLDDIRYIKGFGEYLQIFTTSQPEPMMTLSSFASMAQKLSDSFLQVHRSYIVNMDHVEQIVRNRLVMTDAEHIPVGDSYKSALSDYLRSRSVGSR